MTENIRLERCCTNVHEVREALQNGAFRAELCDRLETGGLTPGEESIRQAIATGLPVNVLIRPREGNFVYSAEEEAEIISGIRLCRSLGANGIVVGALTEDGDIDTEMTGRFVSEAKSAHGGRSMEVTFHRAFDECRDPLGALEEIIASGCDRILTSGQKPSAYEGRELIAELVRRAAGRIIIMPGAGVTHRILDSLAIYTGATEFHGTRLCARI